MNPNSLPGYDHWKTTEPDDEPQPRLQLDRSPREFQSQVINGRRIYEEDFLYDPIGRN